MGMYTWGTSIYPQRLQMTTASGHLDVSIPSGTVRSRRSSFQQRVPDVAATSPVLPPNETIADAQVPVNTRPALPPRPRNMKSSPPKRSEDPSLERVEFVSSASADDSLPRSVVLPPSKPKPKRAEHQVTAGAVSAVELGSASQAIDIPSISHANGNVVSTTTARTSLAAAPADGFTTFGEKLFDCSKQVLFHVIPPGI